MAISKWIVGAALAIILVGFGGVVVMVMYATSGRFIENSATAWVTVSPDQQSRFVGELRDYARKKSLRFSENTVPAPWKMIGMTILTPEENEISIINATAPDRFAVAIVVEHREENWIPYWRNLREFVSARHNWHDGLKPSLHNSAD